jgi:hypothetical protein
MQKQPSSLLTLICAKYGLSYYHRTQVLLEDLGTGHESRLVKPDFS